MNDEPEQTNSPEAEPRVETTAASIENTLAKTEAELAETKDKLLRTLAESENQRRRLMRDRDEAQRYAAANFAKELLDVADNLKRALAAVSADEVGDERVKSLIEGVAATERALLATFERQGIRRIEPQLGERFDHNFHQAMFEVENSGQTAGSVVQLLQAGYQMHERLLRPAMVGVAKGEARPKDQPRVDQTV
jgi:molecular chaperone GrpE